MPHQLPPDQSYLFPVSSQSVLPLTVKVDTGLSFLSVRLKRPLGAYLMGAYLDRAKRYERNARRPFPVTIDRLWTWLDPYIDAETRGNFTRVSVEVSDATGLARGVGHAKRSFDQPRLERGIALALSRAIDDLICEVGRRELARDASTGLGA